MTEIVFATNNPHKLEEARQIAGGRIIIRSLADINCHDEIPETSDTLKGNALQKAHWVYDKYGIACFSDDTGLMVDALGGAPGVMTARYAGDHCSPADNIVKLLREMQGISQRRALFSTVVAMVGPDGERTFEGSVEGDIATEASGAGGFGYDPVFVPRESGIPFAEMTAQAKNAISHRGRAMRAFFSYLLDA